MLRNSMLAIIVAVAASGRSEQESSRTGKKKTRFLTALAGPGMMLPVASRGRMPT